MWEQLKATESFMGVHSGAGVMGGRGILRKSTSN